jgi:uncharacterized membrane protein HdeD (DUF308 family)
MFFFLNRRYPLLRPVVGVAAVVVGVLAHWDVLIVLGAVLTVAGVALAAGGIRQRGLTGGKGDRGSLR